MRILLLFTFSACAAGAAGAAGAPSPAPALEAPSAEAAKEPTEPVKDSEPLDFPADWVGRWHGTVFAASGSKRREFAMILEIAPLSAERYQWRITYSLDDGDNVRDYELVAVDPAAGRYQIDEKNGIVIEATAVDQTLYTLFAVGGAQIDFRYTMTPGGIRVDVVSATPQKATETGGVGDVPEVTNLPIGGVQRALLVRLPDGI